MPPASITQPGIKQVSLTVTDTTGTFRTLGVMVRVQDPLVPPAPVVTISSERALSSFSQWTNRMSGVDHLAVERCLGAKCTDLSPVFVLSDPESGSRA